MPRRLDLEDDQEDPPCLCCFEQHDNKTLAKTAVLVSVALERLAFYALSGNLVLFLNGTEYDWSSGYAMNASFYFHGISCIFYFVGGLIADIRFGRFRLILASFFIYIVGYTMFPVISNSSIQNKLTNSSNFDCGGTHTSHTCAAFVFGALTVIGAGTGMVRANIAPFGADQVSHLFFFFK